MPNADTGMVAKDFVENKVKIGMGIGFGDAYLKSSEWEVVDIVETNGRLTCTLRSTSDGRMKEYAPDVLHGYEQATVVSPYDGQEHPVQINRVVSISGRGYRVIDVRPQKGTVLLKDLDTAKIITITAQK